MPVNCTDMQDVINDLSEALKSCTTVRQARVDLINTLQVFKDYQCENLPQTFCIYEWGTDDPAGFPAPNATDAICFLRDSNEGYWLNIDPTEADPTRAWVKLGVMVRDLGAVITSPADDPDYDFEIGHLTSGTLYANVNQAGWKQIDYVPAEGFYSIEWVSSQMRYSKEYRINLTMSDTQNNAMTGFDDGHYHFYAQFSMMWEYDSVGQDAMWMRLQKNTADFGAQQHKIYSFYAGSDEQMGLTVWVAGEVDLVNADSVRVYLDDGGGNELPEGDFHFAYDSQRLGYIQFRRVSD